MTEKDGEQSLIFGNRLEKRAKHLRKWARRSGVSCYRLFDNDIPEIPLALDLYEDSRDAGLHAVLALYERPYEKDEKAEAEWLEAMRAEASLRLGIRPERIFTKWRRRQRGDDQYQILSQRGHEITVKEGGLSFIVNLSDYLDTGLFLDHRLSRERVRRLSSGASVLNLFCYTGSFSVYAASGGASRVVSMDMSNTYLEWAQRNANANAISPGVMEYVRADVLSELGRLKSGSERFDLIILDPPTFSNSKKMLADFDLNRDHPGLVRDCASLLSPEGRLFFSTNSRRLKFLPADYPGFSVSDLTESTLDEDFRDRKIHRAWELRRA
jgi:23S rRNA G2069 N7-methylase RlmK/C1962 C5-methylase RlmI